METKLLSKILCVILLLFHAEYTSIIKYFMSLSRELVLFWRVHEIGNTGSIWSLCATFTLTLDQKLRRTFSMTVLLLNKISYCCLNI